MYASMQAFKYASIHVCNKASMQVHKYSRTSIQVCKFVSIQVCMNASIQLWKYSNMQTKPKSQAYLWNMSWVPQAYLRQISATYWTNLRQILDMSWEQFGQISEYILHFCFQSSFSSIAVVVKSCTCFSCDEQLKKWRCHSVLPCFRVSVFPCFRPFFFLSVSLKFLLVLKGFSGVSRLKGVSGSFKGISRVFERSLSLPRKFLGCFKDEWRVIQWSFNFASRVFKRSWIGVWEKFPRCFKDVSWKF